MRGRILIVDSDPLEREALERVLSAQGYEIARADEVDAALRARRAAARELEQSAARRPLVAASPAMIELLQTLERLAPREGPLLLVGEPGTGKEAVARALHAQSRRRTGCFAVMDCKAASADELDALLLGLPGRSLPGQVGSGRGLAVLADGGTLYLDAIDALPLPLQRELLRILQEGRVQTRTAEKPRVVDLRVVAATTGPLEPHVQRGRFRGDLLERLAPARIGVPSLRERPEDLPLLVDHFLARSCASLERSVAGVSDAALGRLVAHPWPGNLRELESAMVSCALRAGGATLGLHELPEEIARSPHGPPGKHGPLALKPARKDFEADWIRRALHAARGNRTHAARLLEISHRALLYKLKEFGI